MDDDFGEYSNDMMQRMMSYRSPVGGPKPVIIKHDDTFRCEPDVRGCPIATKPKVFIPLEMYNRWIFLANQLSTEWIAYLKGNLREGKTNEYEITEMYFPKQKAGAAHCEAEEGEIQEGTIAAVHSHVGMNVFFSSTDEAHFNHQIELVVNNKGEILATGRSQLECGRYHRGQADITFTGCEEEINLEKELSEKLTKEYTTYYTTKDSDKDKNEKQQSFLLT